MHSSGSVSLNWYNASPGGPYYLHLRADSYEQDNEDYKVFRKIKKYFAFLFKTTIYGPTRMKPYEWGTFVANPTGGTGIYTNYRWWKRNNSKGGTKDHPPGVWIELPGLEGEKTIEVEAHNFDFSLKCRVYDSKGHTTEYIHNVYVAGVEPDINPFTESVNLKPSEFKFDRNYPNPFNNSTTLHFELPEDIEIKLDIYDLYGRRIKSIADGLWGAGFYNISLDASNLSSGVYIISFKAGKFHKSYKAILLK